MRIAMVTGIFPPDVGGPATYVPVVARGLQAMGHQVTVITSSEPHHLAWEQTQDMPYTFPVVRLNRRVFWAWRSVYYQQKLTPYLKAADVVYANGLVWEVAQVCRRLGKPWVAKIVGDSTWERAVRRGWTKANLEAFQAPSADIRIRLFRTWRNQAIRQARKIIVPSHYLAQIVQGWGVPPEHIHVIYNAIELPSPIPKITNPLTTNYRIITTGRLVPWKHIDEIITAIAPLPDVGLLIVGDGCQRQVLEQQVRALQLAERVHFTGPKTTAELLALLQTSDLFVLNSSYEGLPHSVLEAMAMGVPVIATQVGGTPELVQDGITGRLLPPHAPTLLRAAIQEMRQHPELGKSYAQNAQQFLTQFQPQTMISRCAQILQQVAGEP